MDHQLIDISVWSALPFVGFLLSIAIFPLVAPKFWHRHYPKVACVFFVPMVGYVWGLNPHWLGHTALEYVSFIVLLGSLFYISGGIFFRGTWIGHPGINACFLVVGAILASFVGTTGASMLLIRPYLRANLQRPKAHIPIIFFIFVVSNIGGLLTPLGDPPLFLGFLKGIPFFWTFRLLPQWLLTNACVIATYFCLDYWVLYRIKFAFKSRIVSKSETLAIEGMPNFLFLGGVLGCVIVYSQLPENLGLWREAIQVGGMGLCILLSHFFTPWSVREKNKFTLLPIKEVAILFAAIFACMIPALKLLELHGGRWGIQEPWQYFWLTGALSSFLDNAPTYLTFLSLGKTLPALGTMISLIGEEGQIREVILAAISCGAVFMGANSYIGNGPNFMVKSIAEEAKIPMPSFFGYMLYSFLVLIPTFALITWLFFS